MITQLDTQAWSSELVTGNSQFIELGSTIYIVSQVRADNTFAVFKSQPVPPQPGPGGAFTTTATYTFPPVNNRNTSFDPVIMYDDSNENIYIVGTQDNVNGKDIDVILFTYDTVTDTLSFPITLIIASYVRDSYDICSLLNTQCVVVAVTNPSQIWQTPTVANVTGININDGVITVVAENSYTMGQPVTFSGIQNATQVNGVTVTVIASTGVTFTAATTLPDYIQPGGTYESGFVTWLPGHSLLAMELNGDSLVGITVLDSSPYRSGNAFGAVSAYSPDGYSIEVYYESNPKTVTFSDQIFSINQVLRTPTQVTNESQTIPLSPGPYIVNVLQAGFLYDVGVSYQGGNALTRVSSSPTQGQYTVADGLYTFNILDAGALIYLNYAILPLTWNLPATTLKTFTGRYADSRLMVIPKGSTRTLLQQYYSQLIHQNALVGNLLLGYYDGETQWNFHIQPGSTVTSYIQGTLSVSETVGTFVSYLAEPVYGIRGAWSPEVKTYNVDDKTSYNGDEYIVNQNILYNYVGVWKVDATYASGAVVKLALPTLPVTYDYYTAQVNIYASATSPNLDTINWNPTSPPSSDSRFTAAPTAWALQTNSLDTSTFNMTNLPGFYNNFNFSWLRGSKTVLDDQSMWAIVGEQAGASSGATYISDFDVPPEVILVPDYTAGIVTVLRGTPFLFNASESNDTDLDPLTFIWTFTPSNSHVTLTPNAPLDATATFLVSRSVGGAELGFIVGVVATTTLHQPMIITYISITANVLTVSTSAPVSLADGESVFLYSIGTATFLNDKAVIVTGTSGNTFSATHTHADYSAADTGFAIANPQFDYCIVSVPFNAAPTITFPQNPIMAARNSAVTIQPTYTGTTDPDDVTTYAWTQISGTTIPVTQITGGVNASSLKFTTNGVLIEGETLVWSLTVNDGVNPAVSATVEVVVAPYAFNYLDTLRLTRSIWGGTGIALLQSQTYSKYGFPPSTTNLSFGTLTQSGSLIIAFESDNKGNNLNKTFGSTPFMVANSSTDWDIDYILNADSSVTVNGFISNPGTDIDQTPDWLIAEFSSAFSVFDQSVLAIDGNPASLTTTNTAGLPALVIATVKLYNDTHGALTGDPPIGWTTLLYNTDRLGAWTGAAAAVFYQIVQAPATTITFQWPTNPTTIGNGQMQTSLTAFNATFPIEANIVQRNTAQTWTPLDVSTIYTNFQNIKRSSVLDGTDRYLLISSASVCVFGGINPNMVLLRKLFTPSNNPILDAFHTEDDWTMVLDSAGNLYQFTTPSLINTDDPKAVINLNSVSSMVLNKVFATYSFNDSRVLILTGPDGCLLLEIGNTSFAVEGSFELNVETGLIYGVDNVQFVRTSNVESLSTGKILIGTVAPIIVNIISIEVSDNTVTVVGDNPLIPGQVLTFLNLTQATFLNGVTTSVVSATPLQFIVSFEYGDYATTPEGAGAIAMTGGKTYETLIDLSHGQIIGTWDASNLRNQFVTTGEILFEPNDTYAGRPAAPIMNPLVNQGVVTPGFVNLMISWNADRPDLIQSYQLGTSFDNVNWIISSINSGYIESVTLPEPAGQQLYFRVQSISADGTSAYSNVVSIRT